MCTWEVRQGDCLEVMRQVDAASVDAVVTDPPYGLAFMGKNWDHGVPGEAFWIEVLRVAKPGAHLLAFGGTRTFHRLACAVEDAGWEIRDCVMWVYGSGFPKSHNLNGDCQGWGTALKPAWEPVIVARKPLAGTVAANVQEYGTGALNIDGCRIETEPWVRIGFRDDMRGGNYRSGSGKKIMIGNGVAKSHPAGRWPANLIHDGSEEATAGFPVTGPSKSTPRNNKEFKSVAKGRDLPHVTSGHDDNGGSAARFFYCAKASKADRDEGCDGFDERGTTRYGEYSGTAKHSPKTLEHTKTRNHHPTVKPTALMRYLCRLITPPNGLVLDPFTGSGSTGKAALLEGFRFLGIEREAEYCEIARARIAAVDPEKVFEEAGS